MRKATLKGTTAKTLIHIVLFRIAFRPHCTIFSVEFLACHTALEPIYFGDIKDWNVSVNFIILLNIQLFLYPAGHV